MTNYPKITNDAWLAAERRMFAIPPAIKVEILSNKKRHAERKANFLLTKEVEEDGKWLRRVTREYFKMYPRNFLTGGSNESGD